MANQTVQQINSLILQANSLSDADLNSIIDAVKFRRGQLARLNTSTFKAGDKVKFTSSRSGRVVIGTVRKVAIKNVVVDTPQGGYRVPANMLEAA